MLALMTASARLGLNVVRLHDGDPCLYGAIQEQMSGLLAAGLEFEVVPGVSAYQLAAAKLRVELTIPEQVQTIILSRMSGRTIVPDDQELSSLAAHRSSLCLYLSAKHIEQVESNLNCVIRLLSFDASKLTLSLHPLSPQGSFSDSRYISRDISFNKFESPFEVCFSIDSDLIFFKIMYEI